MTAKRRAPLGTKVRREALARDTAREAARAAKRGAAGDRAAWNAALTAGVNRVALTDAMASVLAAREAADPAAAPAAGGGPLAAPLAFPNAVDPAGRWVPIGPSVVRRGQAVDRPRVAGRVRDLAVDPTGTRAYAATAQGGVWYSGDGGSTWTPVGGWSERRRVRGGAVNAQACGCLLVSFGLMPLLDVVLVGTGEPAFLPANFPVPTGEGTIDGVGVLSALGPTFPAGQAEPWEMDTGLAQLEGLGIFRLLRSPASTAGEATAGATQDVVVACTTNGAYLGRRQALPAGGGNPARDGYVWTRVNPISVAAPNAAVSDAVWLPGGRLVLAVVGTGLIWTDDLGATIHNIPTGQPPALVTAGNMSLAATGNTVYLLAESGGAPGLWRITDATVAAPVVDPVGAVPGFLGVPATLWGTQRDYDQCLVVDTVAGVDRVYFGGSSFSYGPADGDWGACLYCFDVVASGLPLPNPPWALRATVGVSSATAPPGGDGAVAAGAIGNNVHGDVHALHLAGVAPRRQVWAATDGGVFVSDRAGRVGTFAPANTGLASLQPVFVRGHPVNGHLVGTGCQDNGSQLRVGDTVWDEQYTGDGGGVAFHPTATHLFVRQFNNARWYCTSTPAFVDPMTRNPGEPSRVFGPGAEGAAPFASFYSGAATVRVPPSGPNPAYGRLALGTYRVWLTDDLGVGVGPNTWRAIPYPAGVSADGRPGPNGTATPPQMQIGLTAPFLGSIIALQWTGPTQLLVVYRGGIVRFTENPPGTWASTTWSITNVAVAIPRTTTLTDVASIPGTQDFYVATTGVMGGPDETLWHYTNADGRFHRTGLRNQLDGTGAAGSGPRDPVFSVLVDPGDVTGNTVYAGTVTGVWKGTRTTATGPLTWVPYVNGLPQASVQDLDIWSNPGGGASTPRLLRAGVQSRGVWEVDLAHDAVRQTWIRSHRWDDRRNPLTIHTDPFQAPPALPVSLAASPDVVVRPRWTTTTPPAFVAGPKITSVNSPAYDVWTFQTAFRWLYPSVAANGQFSDALGRLVALHRTGMAPAKTAVPEIDALVWADVVGGVRVKADGTVTTDTADPLAVYRAPWQTSRAPTVGATEADLLDLVVPRGVVNDLWTVFREPSTVDVLVHHRDALGLSAGQGFVILLWRSGATPAALMAESVTTLLPFLTAAAGGTAQAAPAGWNLATTGGGLSWATVPTAVDARMPRAVSIDVDLTPVTAGRQVLFLALVGSLGAGEVFVPPTIAPGVVSPPTTVSELVRFCPYAAARIIHIVDRPT